MHNSSFGLRFSMLAAIAASSWLSLVEVVNAAMNDDRAAQLLHRANEQFFRTGVFRQRIQQHSLISSNDSAITRTSTFDLQWRWPDTLSFQIREVSGPGPRVRLSAIHIDDGILHLVNADETAYFSEEYEGLTALNAHHLRWLDPGLHGALFFARLVSGEIKLHLEDQLQEYRVEETEKEGVRLHILRLAVPLGDHSIRSPNPSLRTLVSLWFEDHVETGVVNPVAMHMVFPPEVSEGVRGGYLVGSVQRVLVWKSPGAGNENGGELPFVPPDNAKEVHTPHELLGLPEEIEIEGEPRDLVGRPAPPLTLPTLEGEEVALPPAGHPAPIAILDFWATWCGPCVRAIPELIALVDELRDEGVVLYAINMGETSDTIAQFVEQRDWNVTVLVDERQTSMPRYYVTAIPQTVILDRSGTVRHVHIGADPNLKDDFRKVVRTLLKEDHQNGDSE